MSTILRMIFSLRYVLQSMTNLSFFQLEAKQLSLFPAGTIFCGASCSHTPILRFITSTSSKVFLKVLLLYIILIFHWLNSLANWKLFDCKNLPTARNAYLLTQSQRAHTSEKGIKKHDNPYCCLLWGKF